MLTSVLLLAALQTPPTVVPAGSAAECKWIGAQELSERVNRVVLGSADHALAQMEQDEARRKEQPNPRFTKSALAGALAAAAGSPVDQALLTQLMAFGIQTGLVEKQGANAMTVSLNGQSIAQLVAPQIGDDTEAYRKMGRLRRLGGKVSLGGKGDKFDRDGDGEEDDPVEASALSDSVGWELEYRIWGSRDRRESNVAEKLIAGFNKTGARVREQMASEALYKLILSDSTGLRTRICETELEDAWTRPDVQAALDALAAETENLRQDIDAATTAADRAFVVTAFGAGLDRKPEFGLDKRSYGLRAVWGSEDLDHTFNASWSQTEGRAGEPKPETFKVAYEASGFLTHPFGGDKTKYGIFSSWERFKNVPDAKHNTVLQIGGRVEFDVATGVKIPLTVKWVNHRDLLAGANEVVGNVGITIDLADLKKKPSGQ